MCLFKSMMGKENGINSYGLLVMCVYVIITCVYNKYALNMHNLFIQFVWSTAFGFQHLLYDITLSVVEQAGRSLAT